MYYFSDIEIEEVNNNLIIIQDKIKQLDSKLNDKSKKINRIVIPYIASNSSQSLALLCLQYQFL